MAQMRCDLAPASDCETGMMRAIQDGRLPVSVLHAPTKGPHKAAIVWGRRGDFGPSMGLSRCFARGQPSAVQNRSRRLCRTGFISAPTSQKCKNRHEGGFHISGGGGGNRTPVRRRSAPGATCLVQRSILFRGSTLDKAHRGTSGFCFSGWPTCGNHQRSCDDDPTSTSTCTSGFGARP